MKTFVQRNGLRIKLGVLLILLSLLSCDDSDEIKIITDKKGITLDLRWTNPYPTTSGPGMLVSVYDPDKKILLSSHSFVALEDSLQDGEYQIEIKQYSGQYDLAANHVLKVSGMNNSTSYSFKTTIPQFETSFKKRFVLNKSKNTYLLKGWI